MNKKDFTDHKLKHMINNNYVVVLKHDKDSSNVIIDKRIMLISLNLKRLLKME